MPEETVQEPVQPSNTQFDIRLNDDKLVYQSNQAEFDDCFYSVLALFSWSKTFVVNDKLSLSFSTITDEEREKMLAELRDWSAKTDASGTMFEQHMTKLNLAYYLSVIQVGESTINLKEQPVEKRMEYLGKMVDQTLNFYGTYCFIFNEIVRRTLLDPLAIKN